MKIIKTFETAEIPNPHFISVRALLVSDSAQFEHLSLEVGQVRKKTRSPYQRLSLHTKWDRDFGSRRRDHSSFR